jgi:hypothetical protein
MFARPGPTVDVSDCALLCEFALALDQIGRHLPACFDAQYGWLSDPLVT